MIESILKCDKCGHCFRLNPEIGKENDDPAIVLAISSTNCQAGFAVLCMGTKENHLCLNCYFEFSTWLNGSSSVGKSTQIITDKAEGK